MYFDLNLNIDFVKDILNLISLTNKSFENEDLLLLIEQRLLFLMNEKLEANYRLSNVFEIIEYAKEGFINEKNEEEDFILLIGLTSSYNYDGGRQTLWKNLDNESQSDFDLLKGSEDERVYYNIFKKYNIPFYSKNNLLEKRDHILDIGCVPIFNMTLKQGKALLYKSNLLLTGETMVSWEKSRYILKVKLSPEKDLDKNLVKNSIKIFSKFDVDLFKCDSILLFYILISEGEYNDKKFNDKYFSLHINDKYLEKIYTITKQKLNKKYREDHLDSNILETKTENNIKVFEGINNIKYEKWMYQTIENYTINSSFKKEEYELFHYEKVENTWEEKRGKPYDEITELNCKISIFWGYLNLN